MPKVIVTPELAESLRTMRIKNKILSKDVATHIQRTPSFVSKLESCEIKTIEQDELLSVFHYIAGAEEDFDELMDEIYKTLRFKYSSEEIKKQDWFCTFDTIVRIIPVPKELVSQLNKLINSIDISLEYLVKRINNNESIPVERISQFPINQWYSQQDGEKLTTAIRLDVQYDTVKRILDGVKTTANYMTIDAIAFYSLKIQKHQNKVTISDDEENELLDNARKLLNDNHFYSLGDKARLKRNAKTEEQKNQLITEFDEKNSISINDMLNMFKLYSDYNIKTATEQIHEFTKNLQWDAPFIMKLASLPFYSLESTSYKLKSELLINLKKLLTDMLKIPEEERAIEEYQRI